jgi:conjugal transfer pilus assembly protein TrbC
VLDDGCAPDATYASISGNVSIELALDTIRMRAKPEVAKLAEARLAAIRKANEQPRLR